MDHQGEFAVVIEIEGEEVPLEHVLAAETERAQVALDLLVPAADAESGARAEASFASARAQELGEQLAAQRAALVALKKELGDDRMIAALQPRLDGTQKQMQAWGRTPGEFAVAAVDVTIAGLSAGQFLSWFHARSAADDVDVMLGANPEHYRIRAIATPPGQDVIETMGLYGDPLHVVLTFHDDPERYPEAALADHPYRLCAGGVFGGDGTDPGISALHQFRDTDRGLHARLGIYFPTSFPTELVEGHRTHLAIEFHNWFRAAFEAVTGRS